MLIYWLTICLKSNIGCWSNVSQMSSSQQAAAVNKWDIKWRYSTPSLPTAQCTSPQSSWAIAYIPSCYGLELPSELICSPKKTAQHIYLITKNTPFSLCFLCKNGRFVWVIFIVLFSGVVTALLLVAALKEKVHLGELLLHSFWSLPQTNVPPNEHMKKSPLEKAVLAPETWKQFANFLGLDKWVEMVFWAKK